MTLITNHRSAYVGRHRKLTSPPVSPTQGWLHRKLWGPPPKPPVTAVEVKL